VDLRSLRYFVAVVDEGGVTRAAESLFISQPSLSQTVRQLEAELGVELLDRSGRTAVPTAQGWRLHELARQALGEADRAAERVRQVAALEVGRLVVATSSTFSVDPLVALVAAMRAEHPGLELHVRDAATPVGVLDLVRAGEAEIGLTDAVPAEPSWGVLALTAEEIVLATSGDYAHPVPSVLPRGSVRDLVLGQVDADAQSTSPAALTVRELAGHVGARCAHRVMLWELVRLGSVATFVGRRTAEQVLPWARLHPLDPPLWREVSMVWREGALSPAGVALVQVAQRLHEGSCHRGEGGGVEERDHDLAE
jgi:DNA-binding transcriptional LysR family regulator